MAVFFDSSLVFRFAKDFVFTCSGLRHIAVVAQGLKQRRCRVESLQGTGRPRCMCAEACDRPFRA